MRVQPRVARAWVLAIVWAALVWTLGSDAFSASNTSRVLRPMIEWFVSDFSRADMYDLLVGIRNAAHVVAYALLSLLIVRALWIGSVRSLVTSLGLTLVMVAAMAFADETRQGDSPVRTGSGWDVALDLGGATSMIVILVGLQTFLGRPLFEPRDPMPPG